MIELVITACLLVNAHHCREVRVPTMFVSTVQCQLLHQQALAQIMQQFPKYRVARFKCEFTGDWEDI